MTLGCNQCDGFRLKMLYTGNRCHNMREWADNFAKFEVVFVGFVFYQALPPLSRDLLHERKMSQAFLLISFVLHGIS